MITPIETKSPQEQMNHIYSLAVSKGLVGGNRVNLINQPYIIEKKDDGSYRLLDNRTQGELDVNVGTYVTFLKNYSKKAEALLDNLTPIAPTAAVPTPVSVAAPVSIAASRSASPSGSFQDKMKHIFAMGEDRGLIDEENKLRLNAVYSIEKTPDGSYVFYDSARRVDPDKDKKAAEIINKFHNEAEKRLNNAAERDIINPSVFWKASIGEKKEDVTSDNETLRSLFLISMNNYELVRRKIYSHLSEAGRKHFIFDLPGGNSIVLISGRAAHANINRFALIDAEQNIVAAIEPDNSSAAGGISKIAGRSISDIQALADGLKAIKRDNISYTQYRGDDTNSHPEIGNKYNRPTEVLSRSTPSPSASHSSSLGAMVAGAGLERGGK